MTKIDNPQIEELAHVVCTAPHPLPSEIYEAVALAYNMGVNDGKTAMCDKMLKLTEKDEP